MLKRGIRLRPRFFGALSASAFVIGCLSSSSEQTDEPVCEGSPDAQAFTLAVPYVQASPLDPNVNFVTGQDFETWDWDGNVPDDWQEASSTIASFLKDLSRLVPSPHLKEVAAAAKFTEQILDFTDEHAPVLLEPYATPDLFLNAYFASPQLAGGEWQNLDEFVAGDFVYDLADGTDLVMAQDSLQTSTNVFAVLPFETDDDFALIEAYDEDLLVDDYVGGFAFDRSWLRANAGCGPTLVTTADPKDNGLWGMVVEVEPFDL